MEFCPLRLLTHEFIHLLEKRVLKAHIGFHAFVSADFNEVVIFRDLNSEGEVAPIVKLLDVFIVNLYFDSIFVSGFGEFLAQRHVAGAADMENIVPATCERAGSYDLVVRCTICGEEMLSTHVVTDLAAHSWGKWVVTRGATEAAEGEETRTCSVCGQTQTRPIPKLSPEDEDSSKEDSSKEDSSNKGSEDREDSKRDNTAASTVSNAAPSPKTAASPKTGDEDQRMLWLIALQMSMVCCAACVAQRCARRQRKGAGQSE